ncbi:MAG: cell division protein ZipA [Methylococcales bacterium]|jgi:cell division protein ZipA|nr:cell division protein ZipA [Methylococcales bacterium]MBT7445448.1 cell division protein ZipA [Methylococcales bacterium]
MEPDILRLVLLVFAVVSVFTIFMWDKIRRRSKDESEVMMGFNGDAPDILLDDKQKPSLNTQAKKMTLPSFSSKKVVPKSYPKTKLDYSKKDLSFVDDDIEEPAPAAAIEEPVDEVVTPKEKPKLQDKIIALSVIAEQGKMLSGQGIQDAIDEEKLQFGDMKIFHRIHKDGKSVVFSMINMVEPGCFELDTLAEMETPGITFFLQLPGPQDSMAMFSDMLFTVERFASCLGADVVDGRRVKLTKSTLQTMQDEIVQFDHEVRMQAQL